MERLRAATSQQHRPSTITHQHPLEFLLPTSPSLSLASKLQTQPQPQHQLRNTDCRLQIADCTIITFRHHQVSPIHHSPQQMLPFVLLQAPPRGRDIALRGGGSGRRRRKYRRLARPGSPSRRLKLVNMPLMCRYINRVASFSMHAT